MIIIAHFVLMKKLADAQEAEEKLNGTYSAEAWSCKQARHFRRERRECSYSKRHQSVAPVVVEHSSMTHTVNVPATNML